MLPTVFMSKTNPWLACPKPNPRASLRLFCFPYSGSSAALFYPWSNSLPPTIEVCPIQLPGRGTRLAEPPFTRLDALVQDLAQALLAHLDKPFAFFGHSMGALVSFELARYIRNRYGLSPIHLFVSGHSAPHIRRRDALIHILPESEFLEEVRRLNGMAQEVLENAELMQLLLPILRADFTVCETYVYQMDEPLDCPISAYGSLQDKHVNQVDLAAWSDRTNASFSLRMFPGDHFYINTNRSLLLGILARELVASGDEWLGKTPPADDSQYARRTWSPNLALTPNS